MRYLSGLSLLLGFYVVGEGVARLLPEVPFTGSLWGMLLLFAALLTGAVREAWLKDAASALIRLMGLLFVPVGVGILAYETLVVEQALAIVVAITLGSLATILVVGLVAQWQKRSS